MNFKDTLDEMYDEFIRSQMSIFKCKYFHNFPCGVGKNGSIDRSLYGYFGGLIEHYTDI